MELKSYQKKVIADLKRYLELLTQTQNMNKAYQIFWEERNIPVGYNGMSPYQNILHGIPNICFKVPTGGGKTFIACNSIKPIFDALPALKAKVVVWLVPSDTILEQTVKCLKDTTHPYRQKIDVDFGGRVEVYTKSELLNGQNFNIITVREQLSVMVLSYDSFRGRGKEGLKAYQENSNLVGFAKVLGKPEAPINQADETALFQIINQLSPLVIVDESHHARSDLSLEMLMNFNSCFVLDLTATPKEESNVISFVDAVQLKKENMVKLPVIVYNRNSQQEVIVDAIDLRCRLEQQAIEEEKRNGKYIRPIVLFQAQPKNSEDSTTFEKLRAKLVESGIPAQEIAIKTSEVNELKAVDLISSECPVRYIITINALKEGWDCPFAYILASLTNKTSQVDVEQILGRVLRQPYTKRHEQPSLNMSYVITSSNDFKTTLKNIVQGLNGAGFSNRDYRIASLHETNISQYSNQNVSIMNDPIINYCNSHKPTESDDFLNFDSSVLNKELQLRNSTPSQTNIISSVDAMMITAQNEQEQFEASLNNKGNDTTIANTPEDIKDKINVYYIDDDFYIEVSQIIIPQFYMVIPNSLFTNGYTVLLNKEHLADGFTLKGKPYDIDFTHTDDEIVKIDINNAEGSLPKVFKMSETDQRYFKEQLNNRPQESRIRLCKDIIHGQLNKLDMVDSGELKEYIDLIIRRMDKSQLLVLENSPMSFAFKIKEFLSSLLVSHCMEQFKRWLETGKIICQPSYKLPSCITPINSTSTIGGSLYQAEEEVNGFEYDMVMALTSMPNIKWWHRNISRHGFCINGFVNHYPDFIVLTDKGKIVMIETKGDHLENYESKQKLALGRAWQNAAGQQNYRYYMVFQNKDLKLDGAVQFNEFLEMFRYL